jgi:hypothetical protein
MTTARLISAIWRASSAPSSGRQQKMDQNFAAALQQGRENRWVNVSYASTEILLPPRENPTLLAVWTSPA